MNFFLVLEVYSVEMIECETGTFSHCCDKKRAEPQGKSLDLLVSLSNISYLMTLA